MSELATSNSDRAVLSILLAFPASRPGPVRPVCSPISLSGRGGYTILLVNDSIVFSALLSRMWMYWNCVELYWGDRPVQLAVRRTSCLVGREPVHDAQKLQTPYLISTRAAILGTKLLHPGTADKDCHQYYTSTVLLQSRCGQADRLSALVTGDPTPQHHTPEKLAPIYSPITGSCPISTP